MTDRENVIEGLQESAAYFRSSFDAMDGTVTCEKFRNWTDAIEQVIAMLKAQEPPTDTSISSAIECLLHPQDADDSDMAQAIDTAVRAMRLLKVQEPVEPRVGHDGWYRCGSCNNSLASGERVKHFYGHPWPMYCEECGKKVGWE